MPIDQAKHDALYTAEMWGYTKDPNDRLRHFAMGDAIHAVLEPGSSVFDVGCGPFMFGERLVELGHDAKGIDASTHAIADANRRGFGARVRHQDITTYAPFICDGSEVVVCTEVGEHLGPEHAEHLVHLVAALAVSRIIWSAAPPGQGGTDHVNERVAAYWLDKFKWRGWVVDAARTATLRHEMVSRNAAHCDISSNFYVLQRKDTP
jgi:trans-aconitate methyltransferase